MPDVASNDSQVMMERRRCNENIGLAKDAAGLPQLATNAGNPLHKGEELMNMALWILQVLLAAFFLWHGWLYVAPPAEMAEMMNSFLAPGFRIFIGVAELLAAAGLILPGVTRILPGLTPLAAAGLMIVVGSATVFHLSRGEIGNAITTAVLLVLVTFVAYMRWKVKPISPRKVLAS